MNASIIWSKISPFLVAIIFSAIVLAVCGRRAKQHYQDEGWRIINDDDSMPPEAGSDSGTQNPRNNGVPE